MEHLQIVHLEVAETCVKAQGCEQNRQMLSMKTLEGSEIMQTDYIKTIDLWFVRET